MHKTYYIVFLILLSNLFSKNTHAQCDDKLIAYNEQIKSELTNLENLLEPITLQNYAKRGYGNYGIGTRLTPRLYIVDSDLETEISKLQNFLSGKNYDYSLRYTQLIKNAWAFTIYRLAESYANRDLGRNHDDVKSSIASELIRQEEGVSILAMISDASKHKDIRPDMMNNFGKFVRDKLVEKGTFISNNATYASALSRATCFLEGVAAIVGGVGRLLEHNDEMANIVINCFYLDYVMNDIQSTPLYYKDALLRDCLNDFGHIKNLVINAENRALITDAAEMAISLQTTILLSSMSAGSLGGPLGLVVGISAGIVISSGFSLFNEAEEYFQYYGISSLLYTLAFNSGEGTNLSAQSIHLANVFMDEKVVGKLTKFSTSSSLEIILNFQEDYTETEKWNKYLDSYFNKKKIPLINITYLKGDGLLEEKFTEYDDCINKEKELNEKIEYINRRQRELPLMFFVMWLCSIIGLIIVANFLLVIVQGRFLEAFRNLVGGLFGESMAIAIILYIIFGGSLKTKFYATLGIMSSKVIESSSFLTKEIFGKEMFREETIEAVYTVYKMLENPKVVEKYLGK